MSEEIKKTIYGWLRFAGLIILAFLALTTNIEIFALAGKGIIGKFFVWVAALNLIAEVYGIYYYVKEVKALRVITDLIKKPEKTEEISESIEQTAEEEPVEDPKEEESEF